MRAFPHSPPALLGCARNAPGKPTHSLPTRCTQLGSCAPARTLAAPASCSLRMAPSTLHSTHLHVGHLSATLCIDRLRLAAPAALELPPCKQPGGGGVWVAHVLKPTGWGCQAKPAFAACGCTHIEQYATPNPLLQSLPEPLFSCAPSRRPMHCSHSTSLRSPHAPGHPAWALPAGGQAHTCCCWAGTRVVGSGAGRWRLPALPAPRTPTPAAPAPAHAAELSRGY